VQSAFERAEYLDADGAPLQWHAATVLPGFADLHELYQAADDGNVYYAENGNDDNGVAIALTGASKRVALGAVCLLHTLFVRAEAVNDTVTLTVGTFGSEYSDVSHTYSVDLSGAGDKETKVRLHRDLLGRFAQVTVGGSVSNRPSIRELRLRFIPIREGRYSA
jgi:hypothetical protein